MNQLTLDAVDPIRNELEESYRVWLGTHERVFCLFERFALEMLEKRKRFGIGALTERVRWEVATEWAPDDDGYKINNNWRAYIARDLIRKHPGLADLMTIRAIKTNEEEG